MSHLEPDRCRFPQDIGASAQEDTPGACRRQSREHIVSEEVSSNALAISRVSYALNPLRSPGIQI
jgi:hypothetical protein